MESFRIQTILEVLGKPEEYVAEVIEKIKNQLNQEPDIKIVRENVGSPKLAKEDFYTAFIDLELEFSKIEALFGFCFKYMPANLEIISPEKTALSNSYFTELLNYMITKLHGYDEIARVLQIKNYKLQQQLNDLSNDAMNSEKTERSDKEISDA